MLGRKIRPACLALGCVSVASAASASDDWKGGFAINLHGGAGLTGSPLKDHAIDPSVRSMTYGSGEFEFGMTEVNDDGLAHGFGWSVVLRSVSFGPASWDTHGGTIDADHERPEWTGGGGGLRGMYTYGRLETNVGFVAGNVKPYEMDGRSRDRHRKSENRLFYQPSVGLGLLLFRSRSFDLKLRAAYEPLIFDDRLVYAYADGTTTSFNDHLNAHHIGLAFTFYPGQSDANSGGADFVMHCDHHCARAVVEGGRILVEIGSVVGRAAAEGLLRALAR